MKKRGLQIIGGLLMLALACCSQFFEAGGNRTVLTVDIAFMSADQTPIVEAPVYVIETIGTMHVVTEVLKTDARGHVLLKGNYCLPAVVAARGGSVVVQGKMLATSYQVRVKGGDQPPLDQLAGKPDNKFLNYSRMHTDCG